jgi:hypothetical protein
MPIPATLIIDDGACINLMYWLHVAQQTPLHVPPAFTQRFADLCRAYGVQGKFSVVPMPAAAGRIDTGLSYVPAPALAEFLRIVRDEIAPAFDITPEILTHQEAINLATGHPLHVFEDVWFSTASVAEMTDYLSLSFRILRNVGLNPTGVTSPWATGIEQEARYAEAIGRAYHRVTRRAFCWYFLHCLGATAPRHPWVSWRDPAQRMTVVSVPALTDDYFWAAQTAPTKAASRRAALEGADRLLTPDGASGRLRELYDGGFPLIILTHWQSLFAHGWGTGLDGLRETCERIRRVFGVNVRWTRFSTVARMALRGESGHA